MKEIPLRNQKRVIVAYALVSEEWYPFLSLWNWYRTPHGYAMRNTIGVKPRAQIPMHRVIMGTMGMREVEVDHIDGDRLNNQVENLRIVTLAQNRRNRKRQSTNQTPYKGVGWHKSAQAFRARIQVSGKMHYLGHFSTAVDAARAYNEAAIIHHGEFARINQIEAPDIWAAI